jgi:hypothetical protein
MLAKLINPVLLFSWIQRKKSGRLENQAAERMPPPMPVGASESSVAEMKKTVHGSVVTFEGIYQGKPIRVRIFNEAHSEIKL